MATLERILVLDEEENGYLWMSSHCEEMIKRHEEKQKTLVIAVLYEVRLNEDLMCIEKS